MGVRLPLELEGELQVTRAAGEPPFVVGKEYSCVFGRVGQFSLHMPPQDYHELGVHTFGSGKATGADTMVCSVPKVVTAGNTTCCVMPPNASRSHFPTLRPVEDAATERRLRAEDQKRATCGATPYTPVFFEHFPLFAPAFSRRPYIREAEGALVVELDLQALAGRKITLSIEAALEGGRATTTLMSSTVVVAALGSPLARERCDSHGRCRPVLPLRIPFSLAPVPVSFDADTTIKLAVDGPTAAATHTRRLIRAAPPPEGSSVVTFQVDHETQALLRDGVPFVMSGWFAGGYGFESAGLPPSTLVAGEAAAAGEQNPDYFNALGQACESHHCFAVCLELRRDGSLLTAVRNGPAALTTQWGRDGVTFVRSGSWTDPALAKLYLDAAAAAGVSVLWNVGVDAAARAMARILDSKTNQTGCGTDPTPTNWEACEIELVGHVKGNVTMVMGHPAIGGYYACDE